MRYSGVAMALVVLTMIGCSAMENNSESMAGQNQTKAMDGMASKEMATREMAGMDMATRDMTQLYEVHKDSRIYIFYDRELYNEFVKTGHTDYMFSRIGAGPNGESMVFALTGEDKKKRSGIPSVELVDGLHKPVAFYGETRDEGRLYVFGSYQLMEDYRNTGEATFRFTDIGAGPEGESVVYVLSKKESKNKPEALIALFRKMQ
jgi:uncharacterized protein YceK